MDELPAKVMQKRATMHEPSGRRDLDLVCPKCKQTLYFLGYKWHRVVFAAILSMNEDGEPVLGDKTSQAPYAYWMCADGHVETDGY